MKNFIDMAEWPDEIIIGTLKEFKFLPIDIGYLRIAIKRMLDFYYQIKYTVSDLALGK